VADSPSTRLRPTIEGELPRSDRWHPGIRPLEPRRIPTAERTAELVSSGDPSDVPATRCRTPRSRSVGSSSPRARTATNRMGCCCFSTISTATISTTPAFAWRLAVREEKIHGVYHTLGSYRLSRGVQPRAKPEPNPDEPARQSSQRDPLQRRRSVDVALWVDGNSRYRCAIRESEHRSPAGFAGIRTDFMDVDFEATASKKSEPVSFRAHERLRVSSPRVRKPGCGSGGKRSPSPRVSRPSDVAYAAHHYDIGGSA